MVVAWIFRAEDCLSCNTPVRPFRQLQARYADRVRFQALAVSDAPDDRALVASFLKRERLLSFETRLLDLGQYRGSFGQQTLPAVVVLAGGRLLGVWDDRATRVAEGFGDARTTVDEVLQRVFAREVTDRQATVRTDPSKTPHPSSHQPGG